MYRSVDHPIWHEYPDLLGRPEIATEPTETPTKSTTRASQWKLVFG